MRSQTNAIPYLFNLSCAGVIMGFLLLKVRGPLGIYPQVCRLLGGLVTCIKWTQAKEDAQSAGLRLRCYADLYHFGWDVSSIDRYI